MFAIFLQVVQKKIKRYMWGRKERKKRSGREERKKQRQNNKANVIKCQKTGEMGSRVYKSFVLFLYFSINLKLFLS